MRILFDSESQHANVNFEQPSQNTVRPYLIENSIDYSDSEVETTKIDEVSEFNSLCEEHMQFFKQTSFEEAIVNEKVVLSHDARLVHSGSEIPPLEIEFSV